MSAFGGKADIKHPSGKSPLLAKSGQSGDAVWLVKEVCIFLFVSGKAGYIPNRFLSNRGERFVEFSPLGMLSLSPGIHDHTPSRFHMKLSQNNRLRVL